MTEASVCFVCGSYNLRSDNGVVACGDCGAQSQASIEESEFQEGGGFSRKRYAGSAPTLRAPRIVNQEDPASRIKDWGRAYVACMQAMLQAQCRCLISSYGVHADMELIARDIWLKLLPYIGLLDFDIQTRNQPLQAARAAWSVLDRDGSDAGGDESSTDDDERDVDVEGQEELGEGENDDEEAARPSVRKSGYNVSGRTRFRPARTYGSWDQLTDVERLRKAFHKDLPPQMTLIVCFLACATLRQPIMPTDIVRWAIDGDLPFLDTSPYAATPNATCAAGPVPPSVLSSGGVTTPGRLLRSAAELARLLGRRIANVPAEALLMRMVCELSLPQAVYLVAAELYRLYLIDTPVMSIMCASPTVQPYQVLVALLVIALKLCYGLDGGKAPRLPHMPPPPSSWLDYAKHQMKFVCRPSSFPLSVQQACQLRGQELQDYLTFCRTHIFPAPNAQQDVKDLRAAMHDVVKAAMAPPAVPPTTVAEHAAVATAASAEQAQTAALATNDGGVLWRGPTTGDIGGGRDREGSLGTRQCPDDEQDPAPTVDVHAEEVAAAMEPVAVPVGRGNPSAGDHPRELHTPPLQGSAGGEAHPPSTYLRFARSSGLHHPDMTAVVCVAAAYVDVGPPVLLTTLSVIEGQLVEVEEEMVKAARGAPSQPSRAEAGRRPEGLGRKECSRHDTAGSDSSEEDDMGDVLS